MSEENRLTRSGGSLTDVPLESFIFAMQESVVILNPAGQATLVNDSFVKLLGFTSADELIRPLIFLVGQVDLIQPDGQLIPPERWPFLELAKGKVLTNVEVQLRRKDTRQAWLLNLSGSPILDSQGNHVCSMLLARDISQRKHESFIWHEQQERLRAILNTAADAILTVNEQGIIQSVNPAGERMFGYSAGEMIGHNVSLLMPSPFREEHDSYIARYIRTGEARIIGIGREVYARHKDGSLIPVDLAVSQVDHMGLFTGFIRDIRQRKELEREIVEIAALEQQRIGQNLHDECGQELTALGLLADSLLQSLEEHEPEKVRIAQMMEQGVRRVLRRVRNISRGLAQAQVNPEKLTDALVELTERLSETSGVRFSFETDNTRGVADVLTATHLFHIAQEACTNALKHARARNITVRLNEIEGCTLLEIRDDGVGISSGVAEGLGRRIMQNRASVIGAKLSIGHASPRGTFVTCSLRRESEDGRKKK